MSVNGAKMARLGSARRVVLHLLFSVSSSITSNYCVKSGNRVYYALFSDFFFCGKGDHCRNFTPKCQVLRMFESILSVHLLRQQFLMIKTHRRNENEEKSS